MYSKEKALRNRLKAHAMREEANKKREMHSLVIVFCTLGGWTRQQDWYGSLLVLSYTKGNYTYKVWLSKCQSKFHSTGM